MQGGYSILDLHDVNLVTGGSAIVIKGIYEQLESTRKAVLLTNFTVDGVERRDRFITFGVDNGSFVANIALTKNVDLVYLTITSDDEISVTSA